MDTLLRRAFPFIVGLAIALSAYFQAAGVVELVVGSKLTPTVAELARASRRPPGALPARPERGPTAAALIAHNIFEHGVDLNPKPPEPVEPPEPEAPPAPRDALHAELCAGMTVDVVTEFEKRSWSEAIVKASGETGGTLRREGDLVGEHKVELIGYNWLLSSPAVWFSRGGTLCQVLLFKKESAPAVANPEPAAPPPAPEPPPAARPAAADLPEDLASKISKVSETEFSIDRAVIDNVLENQAVLMRGVRTIPENGPDGKMAGVRLLGVGPKSLLGTLGLKDGDRLETINGFEVANPEKALEAYARLRSATKLDIKVTRGGQPVTLDFTVK